MNIYRKFKSYLSKMSSGMHEMIKLGFSTSTGFRLICILLPFLATCTAFRVSYELDDRFIDYRKDAKWLVMFYAPWCHHCHKVEPVWEQVAQTFNQQEANQGLRIGKIDATKQTKSASEFQVRGFPTIKYIHGDRIITYDGERSREEIEDFALKAIGPAVRRIKALSELRNAERKKGVFFIYVEAKEPSDGDDALYKQYAKIAEEMMTFNYFYETDHRLASGNVPFKEAPAVAVYKDDQYHIYDGKGDLVQWIKSEKISDFVKISGVSFYHLSEISKPIVAAVVEMPIHPATTMDPDAQLVYDTVRKAALDKRDKFNNNFSFGYFDGNEIINQIVSQWIPIPSLVAYDPAQETYYIFSEPLHTLNHDAVERFIEGIATGQMKGFGGKGWFRKAYRFGYGIAAYVYKMFSTQPILASILFGLPLGILGIIIFMTYTNDCSDKASGDDDDDSDHEKED